MWFYHTAKNTENHLQNTLNDVNYTETEVIRSEAMHLKLQD